MPELREDRVGALERVGGDAGDPARGLHRAVRLPDRVEERGEAEERQLARLPEERERELLGVAVERAARVGVDPAAAVAARLDVLEVALDRVALVLLQVLLCEDGVARLVAGVDPVEDARLGLEVEASVGEVLVPVRVLDHDLDLRVRLPGRPDDHVLRGLLHQREAEVAPAARPLRLDAALALAGREEEVVEDQLVEERGREAHHLLEVPAVLGVRVAERLELPALVEHGRDPAGGPDTTALEELLRLQHRVAVDDHHAAVRLQVDLADLELLREHVEVPGQPVPVGHLPHVAGRTVDRQLEVAVAGCLGQCAGREQHEGGDGEDPESAGHGHAPPSLYRLSCEKGSRGSRSRRAVAEPAPKACARARQRSAASTGPSRLRSSALIRTPHCGPFVPLTRADRLAILWVS